MFLVSICVWLNTAACKRLYETGGITNEGGEKTILQSNNMVALRVVFIISRYGMVRQYQRRHQRRHLSKIDKVCTYTYSSPPSFWLTWEAKNESLHIWLTDCRRKGTVWSNRKGKLSKNISDPAQICDYKLRKTRFSQVKILRAQAVCFNNIIMAECCGLLHVKIKNL